MVEAVSEAEKREGGAAGNEIVQALRKVPSLLGSERAQHALLENAGAEAVKMGLPEEAGPALLNIVNAAQRSSHAPEVPAHEESGESEVRQMLLEPFDQITWSFRILTAMSVLMFFIGAAFLVVALLRAVGEQDVSTSTLTIAGLGVADFVLLFYRRPWEDIARGLSNSQQARIIATSYLSGVSMLRQDDTEVHAKLQSMTRDAVELLEEFTEPTSKGRTD